MELLATYDNPIPEGGIVGGLPSSGGVRLRYARWKASARKMLGTVCILQGRGESIERYFETVTALRERGFAVGAFDWRGQGGSDRLLRNPRKGHIDSFEEYDDDLEAFMRQIALPDCPPPYFALAHSTGGMMALRAARSGSVQFSRMVLSAPLVDIAWRRGRPAITCHVATVVTALGLGELPTPGAADDVLEKIPFEGNPLTGDRLRYERNVTLSKSHPQLTVDGPTFGWVYAACTAIAEAARPEFARGIRTPILMIAGGMDRVVSSAASERLASRIRGARQLTIAGARHEPMAETDAIREQFWAAFDAFVPGSG